MTCRGVRESLSEWLDGELEAGASRAVSAHLGGCASCSRHAAELRAVSGLLAELPSVDAAGPVESPLALRLEFAQNARRPGLAVLFRSFAAARPFILPSLVPAACLLLLGVGALLAVDPGPLPEVRLAPGAAWSVVPASGTEANPMALSAEMLLPQQLEAVSLPPEFADKGEDSFFLETVVARDGSVAGVTLLEGDSGLGQPLVEALRQQRFEPVRYRGRRVAVSVYRLISRMEVRSPRT
jgi:anti-sigma factor RsiW